MNKGDALAQCPEGDAEAVLRLAVLDWGRFHDGSYLIALTDGGRPRGAGRLPFGRAQGRLRGRPSDAIGPNTRSRYGFEKRPSGSSRARTFWNASHSG